MDESVVQIFDFFISYFIFLFSVICHEVAHALVGKWGGDNTSQKMGLLTLNPVPHILRSPFGLVLLPIFSFIAMGWVIGTASVPYDPYWAMRNPRKSALMSLAGPGANLLLLILGSSLLYFLPLLGIELQNLNGALYQILTNIVFLNLILFTFNLLPFPSFDGGQFLAYIFLPHELRSRIFDFFRNPTYNFIELLVAWRLYEKAFPPIYHAFSDVMFFFGIHGF